VAVRGVVAAGHPVTAEAGAALLRAGGNAVDAALAALLASCMAEPLLTGLGAGGCMLVAPPGAPPRLLDFMVAAPGIGADPQLRAPLADVDVDFGDALQRFHVGASSCGVPGVPAGVAEAARRYARLPLERLAAPAVACAREGVRVNRQQAYVWELLEGIVRSTPEAAARYLVDGERIPREGDVLRDDELADGLELLGAEGAAPFYGGRVGRALAAWLGERGGTLTTADLDAYAVVAREPLRVGYRGRSVLLNPPPSAGGILIAYSLALLERGGEPPTPAQVAAAIEAAQAERTPAFVAGLAEPGFVEAFTASRLGSTTHVSVLDADGWACAVTTTNGEGSGVVVPGTGLHVNNMMGEADLSPLGWFTHPAGRRLPTMMAPTVVLDAAGAPELVLGSAGSNRIRSAVLQVIVNALDAGMDAQAAVDAPRLHVEDGVLYVEPGVDAAALDGGDRTLAPFRERNLFFGGCQAVERRAGRLAGGGDPRRGGAVVAV